MYEPTTIERREMGISRTDFFRILPRLVPGAEKTALASGYRISWADGGSLEVHILRVGVRRLGLLEFPSMDLKFKFSSLSGDRIDAFMAHFSRSFQKGGG